jgi:hypothetical protein
MVTLDAKAKVYSRFGWFSPQTIQIFFPHFQTFNIVKLIVTDLLLAKITVQFFLILWKHKAGIFKIAHSVPILIITKHTNGTFFCFFSVNANLRIFYGPVLCMEKGFWMYRWINEDTRTCNAAFIWKNKAWLMKV